MFDRISILNARVVSTVMWEFLPEAIMIAALGTLTLVIYVVDTATREKRLTRNQIVLLCGYRARSR